jgi:hypothetical protein
MKSTHIHHTVTHHNIVIIIQSHISFIKLKRERIEIDILLSTDGRTVLDKIK